MTKIQRWVESLRSAFARSESTNVIDPPVLSAESTAVATAPASISSEPTSV